MTDLLALFGAILLVTQVLKFRGLLAFPLPRQRYVPLAAPPDEAADPLLVELHAQAIELGCTGPQWFRVERTDGEDATFQAVYRAPDSIGQLWVAPAGNVATPHRPQTWFGHRLADGRMAVSQPYDSYFESLQGPHLIARTSGQASLALQWMAHRGWVEALDIAPVAIADDAIGVETESFREHVRQDLVASGLARPLGPDLAVPRLKLAWRMRGVLAAAPKPAPDTRPVPPARLAQFAVTSEAVSHRSPPRDVQWLLFGVSVALFMALGVLLWDAATAVYVLVVVMVHELGHFLAMRAFGYRNTHILALPLVGGVAMGHDVDPNATRRAWMSLMGPLPGIVIGWALLLASVSGAMAQSWVMPLATVFLLINYLNVLPVPPLDGAHVLESLLPVRWARLQTIVIGALAVGGALVAASFGLYLITFIALLQLPLLLTRWRLEGVERMLVAEGTIRQQSRPQRLERIAHALETHLGPGKDASSRVQQMLQVLHRIDLKPMSLVARLATALVYAGLLVVPVAGVVAWGMLPGASSISAPESTAEEKRKYAELVAANENLRKQAAALALPELIAALAKSPLPKPASADALRAAEARLGQPLPADLRAIYAIANGIPDAGVGPVEGIAKPTQETIDHLGYGDGKLYLEEVPEESSLAATEARAWWLIGGDDEAPLFYLPEPHAKLPRVRVVSAWMEAPSTHRDVREYLAMRWVEAREAEALQARFTAATARATAKLANTPAAGLLSAWEEPGFALRWMSPHVAWRGPVDADDVREAGERIGRPLPAELVAVLNEHDGFQPLQLLPAEKINPWPAFVAPVPAARRKVWFERDFAGPVPFDVGTPLALEERAIAHCIVVAGRVGDHKPANAVLPLLAWCPDGKPAPWVDTQFGRGHASLREWVLPRAAHMRMTQEM